MKYFAKLGLIDLEDPDSIARFFLTTPSLSKDKLGEFFGDENPANIKVLTSFLELLEFRNMTLDDGLRVFLSYFDLPGEG